MAGNEILLTNEGRSVVLGASQPPLAVNLLLYGAEEHNPVQSTFLPDMQHQLHTFGSQATNLIAQSIQAHHSPGWTRYYARAGHAPMNETDTSHC